MREKIKTLFVVFHKKKLFTKTQKLRVSKKNRHLKFCKRCSKIYVDRFSISVREKHAKNHFDLFDEAHSTYKIWKCHNSSLFCRHREGKKLIKSKTRKKWWKLKSIKAFNLANCQTLPFIESTAFERFYFRFPDSIKKNFLWRFQKSEFTKRQGEKINFK